MSLNLWWLYIISRTANYKVGHLFFKVFAIRYFETFPLLKETFSMADKISRNLTTIWMLKLHTIRCCVEQMLQWQTVCCLTHWGRVTHICVSNITTIGSDNDLSPGRRQVIIWTDDGILSIGPLGINISEILFRIQISPFKKMHLKMSYSKWRPFCFGLNVLKQNTEAVIMVHSTALTEVH